MLFYLKNLAFLVDTSPLPQVGTNGNGSVVQTILNIVLSIVGAVCLLIITIAGFQYITSRGEPQSVAKAKDTILYALVGLVVTLTAGAIVNFVLFHLNI